VTDLMTADQGEGPWPLPRDPSHARPPLPVPAGATWGGARSQSWVWRQPFRGPASL